MARIIGETGSSSRMLAETRRRGWKAAYFIAAAGVLLLLVILLWVTNHLGKAGSNALIPSVIVFILIAVGMQWMERQAESTARHLKKRQRDAQRGAKGEETIAAILAGLPDDYYVFHDLTKLAGDIDHIVVGPTGLFVIETKAHGGKVTAQGDTVLVNGHPAEKDFIAQSWRNAYWVRDVLKNVGQIDVTIQPILVFANAFVTSRGKVKGIRVINKRYLEEAILKETADGVPVERVVEILQRKMGAVL